MFTGLVQTIGTIRNIDTSRGDMRAEIDTNMNLETVRIGASICCSGCCLSVVDKTKNSFLVDVSKETLSKTTLGAWSVKTRINLEPSLKVGDEIGGHFVSGHIDTPTKIIKIAEEGGSQRLTISIPGDLKKYITPKGSITIDGISLTVNEVDNTAFGVNIIPHTWQNTTLSDRKVGDDVNIEIDMLARYVANMMDTKS